MTDARQHLGKTGENLAVLELESRGYAIIERRYRTAHGEIDIIARDGETVVFVEVRWKKSDEFGTDAESVTPAKQRRVIRMAAEYLWLRELGQYPADGIVIARSLLSSFGGGGTITGRFSNRGEDILDSIAKRSPDEVWEEIAPLLGPPIDSRAFHIRQWLRDGAVTYLSPSCGVGMD